MARSKAPFKMEDNTEKIIAKIKEKPHKVLNIIGTNLKREIKGVTPAYFNDKTGALRKSLNFKVKKNDDFWVLHIGFTEFYAVFRMTPVFNPITSTVRKNKELIASMMTGAYDEIRKEIV